MTIETLKQEAREEIAALMGMEVEEVAPAYLHMVEDLVTRIVSAVEASVVPGKAKDQSNPDYFDVESIAFNSCRAVVLEAFAKFRGV